MAQIIQNQFVGNDTGIELFNNSSFCGQNEVDKSRKDGIQVVNNNEEMQVRPKLKNNKITSSKSNGILVTGRYSNPSILCNTVETNKKAGVKL